MVCVAVFLLSDTIGDVLNNPDLAPLIKTLSLAFVVIPHGQQFRALMQKELEFNKNRHDRNQRGAGGLHFYCG